MMVGAKDEVGVSVALSVFSEVLQRGIESGDSGARDLLLSKYYDIVTTCLTYLASQRDSHGHPFIFRLIFIESIFSIRFPTPPAPSTWEPLLPCLCEALLRDGALWSGRLHYIRRLNEIIAEIISSAPKTSASEILSRLLPSHLDSSMAVLDSGGSTDSLNAMASMRWRASIAISLIFCFASLHLERVDDDADLADLAEFDRLCEPLLEAPRALRIVADHVMRGLKEPEPLVQTVSGDRSASRRAVDDCRALSGVSVFIPRALICVGHTAAVIQAGFPDVIMALTQHCQHSNGLFDDAVDFAPHVLGVMYAFTDANDKMMIDMGAVEVVCDLLLKRHAEKIPAHATTTDSPAPLGVVGRCWQILGKVVIYGESRVRPNAPHNKVSQKILQNASVQKLRELHRSTGGLDVQDTSRRSKAKKGRIKGHSNAKPSQPCSPPDPTSCPPSSSSSSPSDQKADGAAGKDAARGATPLAGVLAFLDQIEEKENDRAAAVLADLMATDERAEKDKTAGKGGGKAGKGKGPPSVAESARSYGVCVDGRDASDRVAAAGPQAGSAGAGAVPGERDPQPSGRRRKNRKKKLNKGRGESQCVESVAEEGVEHDGGGDVEDAGADGDDIDTRQERPMSESADTTRPSSRSSAAEPLWPAAKPLQGVGSGTAGQAGSGPGAGLREGHGLAALSPSVSGAVAASFGAGPALTRATDKQHPPQQDGEDSEDEDEHEVQTQMAIAASLDDATTAAMVRPPSMPPSSSMMSGGYASGAPAAAAAAAASLGPLKDAVCRAIEEQQSMERAYGEALERHSTIMVRTNKLSAAMRALTEATQEQPDTLTRDALMALTTAAEVCEFGERVTREDERLDQLYRRACDSSRTSSSDTRAGNGSGSLFGRLPSPSAAFDVARNNDRIPRSSRHDEIADEVDSMSSEGQLREMLQSTKAKLRQLEVDISTVTEATAAAEATTIPTLQQQHDRLLQIARTCLTEYRLSSLQSPEDVEAFKRDITKAREALRALNKEASKIEGRLEEREAAAASAAAAPPPPPRPICGICNDSPPTVLFYPCGHLCLCADCWQQWKGRHERAKAEKARLEGAGQPVPEEVRRYAVLRCPSCRSEPEKTILAHVQTED
ncbi:unnamed protein product [Vitrella brassicaformis CCMP3155]|uniref:RING-type domain-containing protein n=1 Tax=Vitrella brassicaformis (strain CCMP3155) TaxID=1169540 RepID=A0A0G4H6P5_VITBC|nr:unnamed protein product [Vitrella brassicaformis CCMP3155]|eukprot:CEM39349.1 unnamed protein product [Vitrella brassicaformis CCMP3155]